MQYKYYYKIDLITQNFKLKIINGYDVFDHFK